MQLKIILWIFHCEPVISATALSLCVLIFCELWLLHGELWYPLFPLM